MDEIETLVRDHQVGFFILADAVTGVAMSEAPVARIGPNTIIQLAQVLRDHYGESVAARLLVSSTGCALACISHHG